MEWQDEGMVLSARPHGETDAILSALTFEHGRHLGLVKGGIGRRARPPLQPGNRLELTWKARLTEHLGNFAVEPMQAFGNRLLDDPLRLAALASATAPARRGAGRARAAPAALCRRCSSCWRRMLADPRWPETYVRFELVLLQELGFALDLERCAVTGADGRSRLRLAAHRPRRRRGRRRRSGRPAAATAAFLVADVPATFTDVSRACDCPAISWPSTCSPPPTDPCPPPASA